MTNTERLPDEVVWREDGHLDDVALAALADGQDTLLPVTARAHVDACEDCGRRLGEAALLSLRVDEAVHDLAREVAPVRRPLPIAMMAGALVLAAASAIPAWGDVGVRLRAALAVLLDSTPLVLRSAGLLVRSASHEVGPYLAVASVVSAVVLVALGVAIARTLPPRSNLSEGAVR